MAKEMLNQLSTMTNREAFKSVTPNDEPDVMATSHEKPAK